MEFEHTHSLTLTPHTQTYILASIHTTHSHPPSLIQAYTLIQTYTLPLTPTHSPKHIYLLPFTLHTHPSIHTHTHTTHSHPHLLTQTYTHYRLTLILTHSRVDTHIHLLIHTYLSTYTHSNLTFENTGRIVETVVETVEVSQGNEAEA